MILSSEFILRQIADTWVVLPLGKASIEFNGMLTLNETGVLLWKALEQGADRDSLANILTNEYTVHRNQALADVDDFLEKLKSKGCLN